MLMNLPLGFARSDVEGVAANGTDLRRLSPVVLNGERLPKAGRQSSVSRHTQTLETLARTLPRTLPESLEALPGVHIQKTASGHGSPYIRGFTGNRTLAAIDGIRYNNATYRDGPNEYFSHIDTFTLSEVELISGPSSALYGSDAVGGTISLKTKGSDFSAAEIDKWFLNGRQVLRYASGDRSIISRSAIDVGRGQNWGLSLGLSVKEFG
ncbi:MAG: TonB-dependent receptor plug domain-containing protein, partial [Pseudomonadota bacterium]